MTVSIFGKRSIRWAVGLALLVPATGFCVSYEIGDAEVIDRFKLESIITYERAPFEKVWERPSLEFGVGINERVEVVVGSGYGVTHLADGGRHRGARDAWMAVKWRMVDEDDASGMPAIAIEPEWIAPTGDRGAGMSDEHASWALPVRAVKHVGNSRWTGQVSYSQVVGHNERGLTYGGLYEYQITPTFSMGTEVLHDAAIATAAGRQVRANVGFRWNPIESVEVHGLVGRAVARGGDGDSMTVFRFGAEYVF